MSSRNRNFIHPHTLPKLELLEKKSEKDGYKIILTATGRTLKEQADLFAQGRTKEGSIVTYMSKPGAHGIWEGFCMAFDIVIVIDGKAVWSHPYYRELGEYGESIGLFWGGRWTKLNDVYHFQETDGLTSKQIQAGKRPKWWFKDEVGKEDVSDWAKAAWEKAKAKGINDGFGAKNNVTEEQLMVFFDKVGLLD